MFKNFYLNSRFFQLIVAIIFVFIFGHYFSVLYSIGTIALIILGVLFVIDILQLFNTPVKIVDSYRQTPERLSNGDDNKIKIYLKNSYKFEVQVKIIDEIPYQFQMRDFVINSILQSGEEKFYSYFIRPTRRGEYQYGKVNIFISSSLGIISRRFNFDYSCKIPVYPSFLKMRKYELLAISNRLTEAGIKKIRRISNNLEFDQIRDYVKGDDYRTINWSATARRSQLMVNQYQDEKAQHVYSVIDMGRTMKMPFEEMTLLDYAINSSLIISNIAMHKHDKAGLITFSKKIHTLLPADRKKKQMLLILETLYKQRTRFDESNYELLYSSIRHWLKQRSLLLLYTNFEGMSSMQRQLNFFKQLAKKHLVVVIFFENTEVKNMLDEKTKNIEQVYVKTIAEKITYEKKQIVKELNKHGVHAVFTEPKNLNVKTINKYLELKALGYI